MKKNFMIAVNKDNAEAYKKTLIALGYAWSPIKDEGYFSYEDVSIRGYRYENNFCWFSQLIEAEYTFVNIEDFLIWHFTPEKAQAEVELEKLQEQISSLQHQAEKLKASL